jgi:DNA polymerase III alpha subunit
MKRDQFGQISFDIGEVAEMLHSNPDVDFTNLQVQNPNLYNASVARYFGELPALKEYRPLTVDIEEFDRINQSQWYMPEEYRKLDIAEWVLSQCQTQEELQRSGKELLMFQERNLTDLLRFLKYFVDTMRNNKVVWGLGRGSSVSSFVLYLIGIHKINSIYYDLDVEEFLR